MSTEAERAATAALWWADRARLARDALQVISDGLDDSTRGEVAALLTDPQFRRQTTEELESRMIDLAGKAGVPS